jgi:aryl-alcohol dehydrogenase-like predicted oxidoreductase
MQTRSLGSTGRSVSAVGLGAWQLGNSQLWAGAPDHDESVRLVDEAVRLGVTLFDTAPGYAGGRSELILGEAMEGRRDQVVLCTKFGHTPDGRPEWDVTAVEPAVERSLRALRTDYLDIVLMHNPPAPLYDGRAAPHYREFERLADAGVIRWYGASVDWAADVDTVVETTGSRVLEVLLNVFHQEPLPAVQRAALKGLGIIVKVPLDSGWLSGRYDRNATFGGVRNRWTRADIARRAALVERLRTLVPAGTSLTHAALRWLLAQPDVSSVIPGARTLDQLRDNVAAADEPLPADTVAAIERLWAQEIAPDPPPW